MCARENKIQSGKTDTKTPRCPCTLFPAGSKTDLAVWFPSESKRAAGGCDEYVPSSLTPSTWHTHTLTQAHTHTHAHTNGKAENPNRKGDLQSHPFFFLCFSHPEEPCLCGCAQPPLYCLAVSSYHLRLEGAQLEAWLHQSACGRRWCHSPGCIIPI